MDGLIKRRQAGADFSHAGFYSYREWLFSPIEMIRILCPSAKFVQLFRNVKVMKYEISIRMRFIRPQIRCEFVIRHQECMCTKLTSFHWPNQSSIRLWATILQNCDFVFLLSSSEVESLNRKIFMRLKVPFQNFSFDDFVFFNGRSLKPAGEVIENNSSFMAEHKFFYESMRPEQFKSNTAEWML